jgi:nucleoside phosphorylase
MSARRSLPIERYLVGVVCALLHEMTAAIAILDERHQQLAGEDKFDENNYVLGRVHEHNVVIACLPAGLYGTVSAGRVARDMLKTFTGLRFRLVMGIGGGTSLPKGPDIRLGDVVISSLNGTIWLAYSL